MNTEKLTLEMLAPYLPYGLKCYHTQMIVYGVDRYNLDGIQCYDEPRVKYEGYQHYISIDGCKPILRPMSDLLKWIYDEHNRKIFPAQILWSVDVNDEERWETFGFIPDYWNTCLQVNAQDHEYRTFRYFLKWHFDVFGLIEKGLAIDINTLEKISPAI